MATLSQKTDEIAALESLKKDLAKFEMKQAKATKADVKLKIAAKIKGLRAQIKAGKTKGKDVSAKQLANSLLRSRKKFLEMSKKDFNGVIRQLSKKPEYSFLKGMSRTEVINDINRKAKPVGWRFKGRENYKTPTKEQVRKGRANGTVYYENRPNRSDVSQARQLAKGGTIIKKGNRVRVVNTKFNGQEGLVTSNDLNNGNYSVQMEDGKVKGFPFENLMLLSRDTYAKGGEIIKTKKDIKKVFGSSVTDIDETENDYDYIVQGNLDEIKSIAKKKGINIEDVEHWGIRIWKYAKGGSTYAEGGETSKLSVLLKEKGISKSEWASMSADERRKVVGKENYTRAIGYAKGGSLKGHGLAIGDEIVNVYRDDIYVLNRGVVYMVDLSSGKRTMTKMSKDDAISTFEKGGNAEDETPVVRYYFEDDAYEYEKGGSTYAEGGEIDINDIEIPVHYTMFEEEMYEYGKGGIISVGDNVTVRSTGQTMEVSNISKNRSGQVEFTGSKGTFLIGGLKKN
tara:strand:+ start:3747 stop:5282 length:1536 start_codon:yes stop_codon:yes gene_type:complete